jgi:hypothetical protein
MLYALETCALTMQEAGRAEEARYYRDLAGLLAEAGGTSPTVESNGQA